MMKTWNAFTLSVIVAGALSLAGPDVIEQLQSTTLTWQTNNASDITNRRIRHCIGVGLEFPLGFTDSSAQVLK
jgi:hypothetical protein